MISPRKIMTWIDDKVKSMRKSRKKTLCALVRAAMRRCGTGVLALGRAMVSLTTAKHNIKRVWRFLRNKSVEVDEVHRAIFSSTCPLRGPIVVLADWTDLHPHKSLILSLVRDGRSVPFWSRTIPVCCGQGGMVTAERESLAFLSTLVEAGRQVIIVADRGFGHGRWIGEVNSYGWHYVQRLTCNMTVYTEEHYSLLSELDVARGDKPRDLGISTVGEKNPFSSRLFVVWIDGADDPWYLVTDLDLGAREVVGVYRKRMWIEATFRDLKEREWGLGLKKVRLIEPDRHDRHFIILFLAWLFLSAAGAKAESCGWADGFKANTSKKRELSLMNIGFYALHRLKLSLLKLVRSFRVPRFSFETGDC